MKGRSSKWQQLVWIKAAIGTIEAAEATFGTNRTAFGTDRAAFGTSVNRVPSPELNKQRNNRSCILHG
jgi:hypothetical protein